jgi:ABC-type phosphonate transport system ATPase subunit
MSDEWLEELELSPKVIHLDSPSTTIYCQINKDSFDALYNLVVGVNIMYSIFAHDFLKDMSLALTTKLLKSLSGHIVPSLGILFALPILVKGTKVHLNL